MVWDPPREQVNVTRMIIYSFIPILSIYAGWRIQKFWLLFGISLLIGIGVQFPIDLMPFPYALMVPLAISVVISIIVVKHFAQKYNEKIILG